MGTFETVINVLEEQGEIYDQIYNKIKGNGGHGRKDNGAWRKTQKIQLYGI